MTKPTMPKLFRQEGSGTLYDENLEIPTSCGPYMLAEEALAYAEAVRQEAIDEACKIINDRAELVKVHLGLQSTSDLNRLAARIRSLKREGK